MAEHSKWANVQRCKAVVDVRRGRLFTTCSTEIIVASHLGGGYPDSNLRLRMAIEHARGVAMIVVCTNSHRNRTTQDLRATLSQYGGNLGETNSVSWGFTGRGQLPVEATATEEELLEHGLSAYARTARGLPVREQHNVYEPQTLVDCSSDTQQIILLGKMRDVLDDNNDVQNVFHNADLPDEDE